MKHSDFVRELVSLEDSLDRFAYSLTSNKENAKDLVQDTFLKALVYMSQFNDNTNMKAWLFTIMRNTFINNYRRNIKHNTMFDTSNNQFVLNNLPYLTTPETSLSHSEISRKIALLEPEFRIPFQMHSSGYKYKEIANKLHLKIGTVKSRIFLSRQKLMDILKDYEY